MKIKKFIALAVMSIAMAGANAATFSFTGNFANDNDVQQFNFTVGAPSTVSLRSWSYAGGTNAAGQTIARGGFDPILSVFTSTGTLLYQQDDAGCGLVAADAVTGSCWDTFFTTGLEAGNYIATVQQYDNFAVGPLLSNGFNFSGAGNENFRNGFRDAAGNTRDSHWAFDILNVNDADQNGNVPEPTTIALLGLGLLGFMASRRRKS